MHHQAQHQLAYTLSQLDGYQNYRLCSGFGPGMAIRVHYDTVDRAQTHCSAFGGSQRQATGTNNQTLTFDWCKVGNVEVFFMGPEA